MTAHKKPELDRSYKDSSLPVEKRVSSLLCQMTLGEKIAQMMCIWDDKELSIMDEERNLTPDTFGVTLSNGIGQVARISDSGGGKNNPEKGMSPAEIAKLGNAIQKYLVEQTRLGIPAIFHEEALHGLTVKDATSYPQPIGLASTFNPDLIEQLFSQVANHMKLRGLHQALCPVVDVCREPRWGRCEETFGEDPYLVAQCGAAVVRGLQGKPNKETGIIATLKHFTGHGQPESGTNIGPANYSERLLRDVFFSPFKWIVEKEGVKGIMPSYNEIDGVPSHANRWLLKDVLRKEWGYEGTLVSDYYAITELHYKEDTLAHAVAGDRKEAALLAVKAGVNLEMPDPWCFIHLRELVEEGSISEEVIDELITPLLRQKFELGLFENPCVEENVIVDNLLETERKQALQAAEETITLLKNENQTVPLNPGTISKLAVIGPNAHRKLLGGYSGAPRYYTTVYEGLKEFAGDAFAVEYSEGCKITVTSGWDEDEVILPDYASDSHSIAEAKATAADADAIVLCLGENEQTSREAWALEHLGDRTSLDLPGRQNELVEEMLKTGKPVIVLLFGGRPNSINYIAEHVPAIAECWYLGQETGHAVANTLFGKNNPGGKLPISFARSAGHLPVFYNHKPSARRGYLFDETTPLFPFGFGLSYTNFRFGTPRLERPEISVDESTSVLIEVTNTGDRAGSEVVQMYIRDVKSSVTRPVKELKGFKKVWLEPGETRTVSIPIAPDALAFHTISMEYKVEPGEFTILVGNSSRDEDLQPATLLVKE